MVPGNALPSMGTVVGSASKKKKGKHIFSRQFRFFLFVRKIIFFSLYPKFNLSYNNNSDEYNFLTIKLLFQQIKINYKYTICLAPIISWNGKSNIFFHTRRVVEDTCFHRGQFVKSDHVERRRGGGGGRY